MRIDRTTPFEDDDDAACRICSRITDLTFEHLPPRGAGNSSSAEMLGMEAWLRRTEHGEPERGRIVQRGAGAYTLCAACNNRSGALYVPELLEWIRRAESGLAGMDPRVTEMDQSLEPAYAVAKFDSVRPARFLKQVVTMLLALAGPGFPPRNLDLQCFAQDPSWIGLPPNYQFYIALFGGPIARFNGGAAALRLDQETGKFGSTFTLELSHPPFSYILSVDEDAPAIECGNITEFANLSIDQVADLEIQLKMGFGHTVFPLDLRSKAMLDRDRRANEEFELERHQQK